MISAHSYGIDRLAADLDRAREQIVPQVEKVTGQGCRQIQKGVRRRWAGKPHIKHIGRSITYDVVTSGSTVTGQVGAEHERLQGKLAVFIEMGSPTSAPIPAFRPEGDAERPTWERYLERAATDLLGWK